MGWLDTGYRPKGLFLTSRSPDPRSERCSESHGNMQTVKPATGSRGLIYRCKWCASNAQQHTTICKSTSGTRPNKKMSNKLFLSGVTGCGRRARGWSEVLPLALIVLLAAGCTPLEKPDADGKAGDENKLEELAEIIIPVEAELPRRGDISSYFETNTRVEAENQVQIMAEGIGECVSVTAEEGDTVEAGDVLVELDRTEVLATIGQAEVQVRQTQTAYEIAERSLSEGIGSRAERDNAKFAYEQALATLNMQKIQLDKLTVRAPISGLVTRRNVQVGQLVSAGTPVFTIIDPSSFMLTINPPEKELGRLNLGQVAEVTIDALEGEGFMAKVRRINPGVDSTSGTVKVTLDFDGATREKLRDSAFARVRLIMETHENALLVPKDAVLEENAREYVFIIEEAESEQEEVEPSEDEGPSQAEESGEGPRDAPAEPASAVEGEPEEPIEKPGTKDSSEAKDSEGEESKAKLVAERVEVETGLEESDVIEIVSGVDDDTLVVTLGQHTLKPGSFVTITNASAEILAKAGLSAEDALKAALAKREDGEKKKRTRRVRHRRP